MPKSKTSMPKRLLILGFGLIVALVLLEVGLRLTGFMFLKQQEERNVEAMTVHGDVVVLCVGESTTAVGGNQSYPSQLQRVLNNTSDDLLYGVVNRGIPGTDTSVIIDQFEENLETYQPQVVVAMMGANDFSGAIPSHARKAIERTGFPYSLKIYKLAALVHHQLSMGSEGSEEHHGEKPQHPRPDTLGLDGEHDGISKVLVDAVEQAYVVALDSDPGSLSLFSQLVDFYDQPGRHDEAEAFFERILAGKTDRAKLVRIARYYESNGDEALASEFFARARRQRGESWHPMTEEAFRRMHALLIPRGISMVVVQYPTRSVEPLKLMLEDLEGIVFVDNEALFNEAVAEEGYSAIFVDACYGDFGHATRWGNRMLARNVARAILPLLQK